MIKCCKLCGGGFIERMAGHYNHYGQYVQTMICSECDHHSYHYRQFDNAIVAEWIYLREPSKYIEFDYLTRKTYLWLNNKQSSRIELSVIDVLTFEIAKQWMEKLKTYIVFQ